MAKRYFVHTLGCKLNQFDAARVEGLLRAGGFERTDDPAAADVVVLNTCTVTARADAEGRRLARLYRRLAPNARIVAAGCYAQRDPEGLAALGVFDAVVPLAERERLPRELLGEEACAAIIKLVRESDAELNAERKAKREATDKGSDGAKDGQQGAFTAVAEQLGHVPDGVAGSAGEPGGTGAVE